MSRFKANMECIEFLVQELNKYPDLRMEQLLWNLDQGQDHFYEEPDKTLKRWKNE